MTTSNHPPTKLLMLISLRIYLTYRSGGSILASLGSFQQMWVSKQEYEEGGRAQVKTESTHMRHGLRFHSAAVVIMTQSCTFRLTESVPRQEAEENISLFVPLTIVSMYSPIVLLVNDYQTHSAPFQLQTYGLSFKHGIRFCACAFVNNINTSSRFVSN